MSVRRFGAIALVVLAAAILQAALGTSIKICGVRPDIVVVVICCCGGLSGPVGGMTAGFWGGILTASLTVPNPAAFVVSRLVCGALSGWLQLLVLRNSLVVPPLVTFGGTLVAEGIFFVISHPGHTHAWAIGVAGELVYNTLLSIPIWLLLVKIGISTIPNRPFDLRGS